MTPSDLDRLWRATPMPRSASETAVCATGVEVSGFDVVVAHDHIGRRHFLIPFGQGEELRTSLRGTGIRATAPRPLVHEGITHLYLDVVCSRPHLNGAFCRLAAELLAVARSVADRPAKRCEEVLREWRELFGSGGTEGFGPEERTGLLGELLVVERLAIINPTGALDCWTGPLGGIHDFRRGQSALEVKTTLRRRGMFFYISSVDQLAPPESGRLGLCAIRLDRVPEGSCSLSSLIRRIEALHVDSNALYERLADIGYVPGENPESDVEGYELRDFRIYIVTGDFPRIVPSTFPSGAPPAGVIALNYEIDLSTAPPPPLDPTQGDAWLREFIRT